MLLRPRRLFLSSLALASVALVLGLWSTAGASLPRLPYHRVVSLATQRFATVQQSSNWSGYDQGFLDTNTLVTSVSGQWTVPTATQHKTGEAESSADWLGIGGGCVDMKSGCLVTDPSLVQAGTEQDVSATGQATYSAWYEILPLPSTTVSLTVNPGDLVSVSIKGPGLWSIVIKDLTTGQSSTTQIPYASTMDTVEWIEEAPLVVSTGGGNQPSIPISAGQAALPNLTSPGFDKATVNGSPAQLTPTYEMQMVDSSGNPLATPSAPAPDADGFNVCTYSSSCAAPSS